MGLANEHFPMNQSIGTVKSSFGVGINRNGTLFQLGTWKDYHGPGFFTNGDVVGCGVMVPQRTKNVKTSKCEHCKQESVVFFTKNGQLWGINSFKSKIILIHFLGTPFSLPSDVPPILYPAVSVCYHADQVTANFGQEPFKFAIPPAEGLNAIGHCCHCKQ